MSLFTRADGDPGKSPRREIGWCLLILLLATFLVSSPTLVRDNYFLADDFGLIHLLHEKPITHFFKLFLADWTEGIYGYMYDEIRPTLAYSYKFDYDLWGIKPLGFHLTNTLLHLLNVFLVFWIARTIAPKNHWIGLVAGLLFAVSAVHAETIGWISGRVDSIAYFFYFGAFLCFLLFRERNSYGYYVLAIPLFILGLFTKQSVVTLPLMIIAYDLFYTRRDSHSLSGWLWKQAPVYIPFLALLVLYIGIRLTLFGHALREETLNVGLVTSFVEKQGFYLLALFAPANLMKTLDPTVPIVLAVLSIELLLWLIVSWRRQWSENAEATKHILFFGLVWYGISVLPLIVVPYLTARHLYQAAAGVSIALAFLISPPSAQRVTRFTRVQLLALAFLLVFYGAALVKGNTVWRDTGRWSKKLSDQIEGFVRTIPEGSRVVLAVPSLTDSGTWGWSWAFPYALGKPFRSPDVYANCQVIENPHVYCCPLDWGFASWWEKRAPIIQSLVSGEADDSLLYIINYDESNDTLSLRITKVNGEELKNSIEQALKKPFQTIMENVTDDEAQVLMQTLAAYKVGSPPDGSPPAEKPPAEGPLAGSPPAESPSAEKPQE